MLYAVYILIVESISEIITTIIDSFFFIFIPFIYIISTFIVAKDIFGSSSQCGLLNESLLAVFTLIVIIPIVNSLFDFISYSVSKGLINHLLKIDCEKGRFYIYVIAHILLDLLIAVLLFTCLAMALYAALDLFFSLTLEKKCNLIDLRLIVDNINEDPFSKNTGWILLVLLTTLVPTAVHTFVAVLSLVRNVIPKKIRDSAIEDLDDDMSNHAYPALVYTVSTVGASIIIIFFLIMVSLMTMKFSIIIASHIYNLFSRIF